MSIDYVSRAHAALETAARGIETAQYNLEMYRHKQALPTVHREKLYNAILRVNTSTGSALIPGDITDRQLVNHVVNILDGLS
jgi:hypothetical protein